MTTECAKFKPEFMFRCGFKGPSGPNLAPSRPGTPLLCLGNDGTTERDPIACRRNKYNTQSGSNQSPIPPLKHIFKTHKLL
jgi:hypothetical protein